MNDSSAEPPSDAYQTGFDPEDPVADQMIEAIDESGLGNPTEPLYSAIDLDALNDLFSASGPGLDGRLVFRYDALAIAVFGDGRLWIAENPKE